MHKFPELRPKLELSQTMNQMGGPGSEYPINSCPPFSFGSLSGHHYMRPKRKHVLKACDCVSEGLEIQNELLSKTVKSLWKIVVSNHLIPHAASSDENASPSIHAIMEQVGIIREAQEDSKTAAVSTPQSPETSKERNNSMVSLELDVSSCSNSSDDESSRRDSTVLATPGSDASGIAPFEMHDQMKMHGQCMDWSSMSSFTHFPMDMDQSHEYFSSASYHDMLSLLSQNNHGIQQPCNSQEMPANLGHPFFTTMPDYNITLMSHSQPRDIAENAMYSIPAL
ncbi:hypothetical protein KEM56_007040 [Ascosphaera pollenicola]|nr:hypothetical protein KEM56_007040 [Ascosphaera pollenicola]